MLNYLNRRCEVYRLYAVATVHISQSPMPAGNKIAQRRRNSLFVVRGLEQTLDQGLSCKHDIQSVTGNLLPTGWVSLLSTKRFGLFSR